MWKSETGSHHIRDVVLLRPLCYSILLQDGAVKMACKGINRPNQNELKHEPYRDIVLQKKHSVYTQCYYITSVKNQLQTITRRKLALSFLDTKRYWVSPTQSHGYGFFTLNVSHIVEKNQKRKNVCIKPYSGDAHLVLTHKRSNPGRQMLW